MDTQSAHDADVAALRASLFMGFWTAINMVLIDRQQPPLSRDEARERWNMYVALADHEKVT